MVDSKGTKTPVIMQGNAPLVPGQNQADQHGAGWFGPLNPLVPIAPPEVAGRQFDYPSGYNLTVYPRAYEGLPVYVLRGLADSCDILRIILESRKDQVVRLDWSIGPRDPLAARAAKKTGKSDPRAAAAETFFRSPDAEHTWDEWLRMLLEDLFVLDAACAYKRREVGGALYGLEPIDGGTIKRVIDDWGRTPAVPYPAYQQILKGFPAVNYTRDDLIYKPRNQRTNRVYGYSAVEQIIMTVNICLRRETSTLQYFTEGNVPEALIGVPDDWTPDQIKQFQDYFDGMLEGNTSAKRHAKFVPSGVGKTFVQVRDPDLKSLFDEWLARIICFTFGISPTPFVSQVNRATAETEKQRSEEDGLVPIQRWVKSLIDSVLLNDFGLDDLEFKWAEDEETDQKTLSDIITGQVGAGLITRDEGRDRLGYEPLPNNLGATALVTTPTGPVPIDAFEQQQAQAQANANAQAKAAEARLANPAPAAGGSPVAGGQEPANDKGVGKTAARSFRKGVHAY